MKRLLSLILSMTLLVSSQGNPVASPPSENHFVAMTKTVSNMNTSKPTHVKPLFYTNCYLTLKEIALKYGYNLVIHGSLNRDFDLIAIPWEQEAKSHMEMLNEFVEFLGGHIMPENEAYRRVFAETHHGRMRYVINLNRGGKETNYEDPQWYLDISIIPIFTPASN